MSSPDRLCQLPLRDKGLDSRQSMLLLDPLPRTDYFLKAKTLSLLYSPLFSLQLQDYGCLQVFCLSLLSHSILLVIKKSPFLLINFESEVSPKAELDLQVTLLVVSDLCKEENALLEQVLFRSPLHYALEWVFVDARSICNRILIWVQPLTYECLEPLPVMIRHLIDLLKRVLQTLKPQLETLNQLSLPFHLSVLLVDLFDGTLEDWVGYGYLSHFELFCLYKWLWKRLNYFLIDVHVSI